MQPALDYDHVGLISGLEVHQQLLTNHKLFCRCPAGLYTTEHDGEVLRHMRPTLSELGEYDGTALMEFKTRKQIVYWLNHRNVCTYEMDDTPPFLVNQQALDVAIELCLMMNMDIIDEVHIARKQYLDGSIPTGFQRTAIVGVNGYLPFQGRRLTVTHLSIEEDSCREVSDRGHQIVFRTDRLGMPLTETVTGAELYTPQQVRDAILLCGLTARSTRHVRTGIGAARQDVNVSVRGGNRVEIKGVMKAAYAVKLVHNEGIRQVNLLELRQMLSQRGITQPEHLRTKEADVTALVEDTPSEILQRALARGERVFAVWVAGVAGLTEHPTQPGLTFADELAGRVRVIACLDEPPILLTRRELKENKATREFASTVEKRLGIENLSDWYLVWGPKRDCETACEEIRLRWVDAIAGVPKETRQALLGGTTTFERILPGPDRMYPDTDSPPTRITADRVQRLRDGLGPAPWKRHERYDSWGVPRETTDFLIRRGGADVVDRVVEQTGVDGLTAAIEIGQRAKAWARKGAAVDTLAPEQWVQVFDLYADAVLPREAILPVAALMAQDRSLTADQATRELGIAMESSRVWMDRARGVDLRDYKRFRGDDVTRQRRYMTGKAVSMLKGKAPAKEVAQFMQSRLRERDEQDPAADGMVK